MGEPKLIRAPVVRAYDHRDATVILGEGRAEEFRGPSAALVRALLDRASTACTHTELIAQIEALAGGAQDAAHRRVIAEAIDRLIALGALREASADPHADRRGADPAAGGVPVRLVLAVSGAVSAMHAPVLAGLLLGRGFQLRIASTQNALRFFGAAALQSVTHQTIYSSLFQSDAENPVPHINLSEWAEMVLICPATASTIARIACGDCSDLVSAIATAAIATGKPVVLVPSMNPAMLAAPAVARNLEQLREDGFFLVHSALGVEVAHAPHARVPIAGPQPPIEDVVRVVEAIAARIGLRSAQARFQAPQSVEAWDRLYAAVPTESLPWFAAAIDPELDRALAEHGLHGGRFLDAGAGSGTVALEMHRRGFAVTAVDVSERALEGLHAREGSNGIELIAEDIVAFGAHPERARSFDILHDRACFHCLPPARRPDYARAAEQLVVRGGWLLLEAITAPSAGLHGVFPVSREELAQLFQPAFELISAEACTIGAHGAPAIFCAFRRSA